MNVSSLPCKCVFYRPEHMEKGEPMELKFEGIEIWKWNILMDRAQRVDEKNGVICLFIIFTPEVMVMTMSNMAHL